MRAGTNRKQITFFFMSTDTTASAGSLHGTDGYMPFDVRVTSLAGGQELLTGFFKDTGSRHLPDRPVGLSSTMASITPS